MGKKWWALIVVFFAMGGALTGIGFLISGDAGSFLENIIAELIGLTFALSIAIWVIEGPILKRERRKQAILRYKKAIYQRIFEPASLDVVDIARSIAHDFEPSIDLYGYEETQWDEFRPLVRRVFRQARDARQTGIPNCPSLDKDDALSIIDSWLKLERQIRDIINSKPDFATWEILGQTNLILHRIKNTGQRAKDLNLLQNEMTRYEEIGTLGELLFDLLESLKPLPEGSDLW